LPTDLDIEFFNQVHIPPPQPIIKKLQIHVFFENYTLNSFIAARKTTQLFSAFSLRADSDL